MSGEGMSLLYAAFYAFLSIIIIIINY